MILLLASTALADSITLDTGATIEGDLARYEYGGNCQLSVTEGELAGVILIVPCHRVQSFVRTSIRSPVPIGVEAEAERQASAASPAAISGDRPAEARVESGAAVSRTRAGERAATADHLAETALVAEEIAPEATGEPLDEPLDTEVAPAAGPEAPAPAAPAAAAAPPPLTTFGGVVDGQLLYDEPLFPDDPVSPVSPDEPAAPAAAATPSEGPRRAPRMDEPVTRPVQF